MLNKNGREIEGRKGFKNLVKSKEGKLSVLGEIRKCREKVISEVVIRFHEVINEKIILKISAKTFSLFLFFLIEFLVKILVGWGFL